MMKTTHKLAIGGVLIGAVASMTSPIAANAAPEPPSGAYQYTDQIPGEPDSSATWHFNPCGPDCTVLTNAEGTGSGLFVNWKFHSATADGLTAASNRRIAASSATG